MSDAPGGPSEPLSRAYFVLFTHQLCASVAFATQRVVLPLVLVALTTDARLIGAMSVVVAVTSLLLGPVLGALVDRIDRKGMLVWLSIAMALLAAALATLEVLSATVIAAVYAVGALSTSLNLGRRNAVLAVMRVVTPLSSQSRGYALYSASFPLVAVVSSPIVARVFEIEPSASLMIMAGSWAVAGIVATRIPYASSEAPVPRNSSLFSDLASSGRWIWAHRDVRLLGAFDFLLGAALGAVSGLLVLRVRDELDASSTAFGVLSATMMVGAALGALAAPRALRRLRASRLFMGITVLIGASMIALAASEHLVVVGALLGFGAAATMLALGVREAVLQSILPSELFGRVRGLFQLSQGLSGGIGAGVSGLLAHALGLPETWMGTGILVLVVGTALAASLRNLDAAAGRTT